MSYYITTEVTADLSDSYFTQFNKINNYAVADYTYWIDDDIYEGNKNLDFHEFYEKMKNGSITKTSLINIYEAKTFLTPILEQGYDVIHVCLSSGLSGTYKNWLSAKEELEKEFPDRKIFIVDSINASLGQGLLYHYGVEKRKNGASIEECYKYLLSLSNKVNSYFMVNDLKYLARTGRTTRTEAFIGTALQIKPILYVTPHGKLTPISKAISKKKALMALADKLINRVSDFSLNKTIFISHGDALDDAEFLKGYILSKTPVEQVYIDIISPTIGAHSGPGTIALFFIADDKYDTDDKSIQKKEL